jgi:predicted nucleotidyltransferase
MLINLIDFNCAKILLLFLVSPGRNHNRKEIKEKTEMNNVPLDNSLKRLIFFKLIKQNNKIYSLNLENPIIEKLLLDRQVLINIPLKIQFILLELVYAISAHKEIAKVILFGSYSKLIFTEKSDIDIAIVLKNKANLTKLEREIFSIKNKISKKHKKDIQTHFFEEDDLKHKEDPLIKDILMNGKVLN